MINVKKIIHIVCASFLLLAFLSCNKDDGYSPTDSSIAILADYSSFEIAVSGNLRLISEISKTPYGAPNGNYGITPYIDFCVNNDNTIDVFWREDNDKRHISRISITDKSLVEEIPIPTKANSSFVGFGGGFLGFASLGNDKFIIGYSTENALGQKNTEAWYTAFDKSGTELFSTRIFGDGDQKAHGWDSKGDPGQAGSATITYSKETDVIAIYLAHKQKGWNDDIRHQAGWVGFLNGTSGELVSVASHWFCSHNFNQRCIISSENKFYTLAHGDAFPRALAINRWSVKEGDEVGLEYYKIQNGTKGNNTTLATTGDFVELSDGSVAIAYSTEDGRAQRDLRVAIINGMKSTPSIGKETWVTSHTENYVGWGIKLAEYRDNDILVGWNNSLGREGKGSSFAVLNVAGEIISKIENLEETVMYPSQSMKKTSDGETIIFVSAKDDNHLKIHLIPAK